MVSVQAVTMKFNGEDGALIWRETYSTGVAYRGRKILTDASGNIYVGGDVNAWMIYHGEVGNMMVKNMTPMEMKFGQLLQTILEIQCREHLII